MAEIIYGPNRDEPTADAPWEPDSNNPEDITEWSAYGFYNPYDEDPDVVVICWLREDGKWDALISTDYVNHNDRKRATFDNEWDAIEWCNSYWPTNEQWEEYARDVLYA